MVQKCCVRSCKERKVAGSKLGFFSFPKPKEIRKKWLAAVNRTEVDLDRNKDLRVCSNHFCASDYVFGAFRRKLKRVAVPVVRDENMGESNKKVVPVCLPTLSDGHEETSHGENLALRQVIIEGQAMKLQQQQLQSTLQREVEYLKEENNRLKQVQLQEAIFSIQKFMHDDKKILYYTGFDTFNIMTSVYELILPSVDKNTLNIIEQSGSSNELAISSQNQFFLTMIWLRRGLEYETLGDMFSISRVTAEKICLCWINAMYSRLDTSSIWPHRNILIKNTPVTFRERYKNFIGRIDCIEFQIERHSLVNQSERSENSKTLKSLLLTDPNGAILYMSRLFPGSFSDKGIIKQSGFLDVLKGKIDSNQLYPGDIILAGAGFNVSSLFKEIDLNINVLTYRFHDLQFTEEELRWIRQVSSERIHLEKAISRLKQYRILVSEVPMGLLSTIEEIYTVCCILTNFRNESR